MLMDNHRWQWISLNSIKFFVCSYAPCIWFVLECIWQRQVSIQYKTERYYLSTQPCYALQNQWRTMASISICLFRWLASAQFAVDCVNNIQCSQHMWCAALSIDIVVEQQQHKISLFSRSPFLYPPKICLCTIIHLLLSFQTVNDTSKRYWIACVW